LKVSGDARTYTHTAGGFAISYAYDIIVEALHFITNRVQLHKADVRGNA